MATITIEQAETQLRRLIEESADGEEIVITHETKPVATLTVHRPECQKPRPSGTLKGSVLFMAPDFNAPLEEFKEYMP